MARGKSSTSCVVRKRHEVPSTGTDPTSALRATVSFSRTTLGSGVNSMIEAAGIWRR
jgi:hypothetical protein